MSIKNTTTSPPDKQAGLMVNDPEWQLVQTFKRWQQELKSWHYCRQPIDDQAAQPVAANHRPDTHEFGREAEQQVTEQLEKRGYTVSQTSHKAPFDLLAQKDGKALEVEVKGANWTPRARRPQYGRFQANIRNKADMVIFACKNGTWHYFCIPARSITGRTMSITSYQVEAYRGRYAKFLEAWPVVDFELKTAAPKACQLSFLEGGPNAK